MGVSACTSSDDVKNLPPPEIPVLPDDSCTVTKPDTIAEPDTIAKPDTVVFFTGLPVIWIDTEGGQGITSKEVYQNACLWLTEDTVMQHREEAACEAVSVKGRGNTTWELFDKKPYRLKFDQKVSLLGMPAGKSWVLLANYNDRTMLRNYISLYLGRMSLLSWTPRAQFVELMLNGAYNGTYLLAEKIKVGQDRLNIGPDGILMEQDAYATREEDSRYFTTDYFWHEVSIKEPAVEYGDDTYNFAKALMTEVEAVLFSDDFMDEAKGWRHYLDEDSFVDWYLVNEMVKNMDAMGWSSIYFNYQWGGKLKMGPLWDFDLTFGNCEDQFQSPEGYHVRYMPWIERLFQDPSFVKRVQERFAFFYGQKETVLSEINETSQYLKYAAKENENRWHTMYVDIWRNPSIRGGYEEEVQFMKDWFCARMDWLKQQFDNM